jgi:methyl-accepting chemotaxis protein
LDTIETAHASDAGIGDALMKKLDNVTLEMAEVAGSVSEIARFVNDQQQLFDQLRDLVKKLAADIGDIDEAGRETTEAAHSAADQSALPAAPSPPSASWSRGWRESATA